MKRYNWREDDSGLLARGEHKALEGQLGERPSGVGMNGRSMAQS